MKSSKYAIKVKSVSKTFSIKERNNDSIRKKFFEIFKGANKRKEIKALDDISFNVKKGEFIGIIGSNGSGKSTLLRLLLGSYKPDKGSEIKIEGSIMRLALGMGFDPNLSARENVYVNGSIIGLSFTEIGELFKKIICFAEIEEFVDSPIKYFSSGMKSRLAFSIAVNTKANILLIDEFFGGVGDEKFKKKSAQVFKNTILENRTIVFVSHNLKTISEYCDRVILLEKGKLVKIGPANEIIAKYKAIINS